MQPVTNTHLHVHTTIYKPYKHTQTLRMSPAAVKVRLHGDAALEVLQKLVYIVLPQQPAFVGVPARSLDAAGNLHFR